MGDSAADSIADIPLIRDEFSVEFDCSGFEFDAVKVFTASAARGSTSGLRAAPAWRAFSGRTVDGRGWD
jgi:hypothetical protein